MKLQALEAHLQQGLAEVQDLRASQQQQNAMMKAQHAALSVAESSNETVRKLLEADDSREARAARFPRLPARQAGTWGNQRQ